MQGIATASAAACTSTALALASPDRRLVGGKRLPNAEELDARQATPARRPEIEDPDAVLTRVHLFQQLLLQPDELDSRQVADEHRVLERLAESLGDLMHPPEPPRIADVVGEQVTGAVGHSVVI